MNVVSDTIREQILARLRKIEADERVKVLFACESGSRGWGFASADSDYDVRFLYIRPTSWYLGIDLELKRDVIEPAIEGEWDFAGWDLRKALQLLRKSNPPLMEWLQSPIIYCEATAVAAKMRSLVPVYFSSLAATCHYLHMAEGNHRDYLKGERVLLKKYLYVLRPLLAVRWIQRESGPAPMEFQSLVDRVVESEVVREAIERLLKAKRSGAELGLGNRIPALSDFIEAEMRQIRESPSLEPATKPPVEELNQLFRFALDEAWGMRAEHT